MNSALPEGWESNTLGGIADFSGGNGFKEALQGNRNGDFPFIKVSDMNLPENNKFIKIANNWVSEGVKTSENYRLFPNEATVFAKVGAALLLNKRRMLVRDTIIDNNMMAAIPRNCNPYYLYFTLQTIDLKNFAQSGALPSINQSQMNDIPIDVPPLPEQEKIAVVLGSVDDVIEKTALQIKKLNDLKKSTMNELLTKGIGHTDFKPSELGQIPKGWEVFRLQDLCHISHGFPFLGEYFSNIPNDNILLTPGNFNVSGGLYYGKKTKYYTGLIPDEYILQNGDVVVVMTDLTKEMAILGNAEIVNHHRKILHNQRIGKLSFYSDKLTKDFAKIIINSDKIKNGVRSTATGTTVRHTSPTKILDNFFAMPPLPEQKQIASILDSISTQIEKVENKLNSLNALKKSLMQDLLSGKVRVRV